MGPSERHAHAPEATFDGGDLDCGNGLLPLIRRHIDPLARGDLLEIRSTETSVEADLPAWCRLTGNELVSWTRIGRQRSFLVCKGLLAERAGERGAPSRRAATAAPVSFAASAPAPAAPAGPPPPVPALAVLGIGSWPRPRWLQRAIHERLEGRMEEGEFESAADDAVRLAVESQRRAGVDVLSDGEQRRDSYASFVGARLEGCQLIPLTDLLALVPDPEELAEEMRSLDVPASEVRHPAVLGRIRRTRPIASHEARFLRSIATEPVKVAIPGPYLLSRVLWIECIPEQAYRTREDLEEDIVRVLREEIADLLEAGVSIVQLDEPVLTEVVHGAARQRRSFMCGALRAKGDPAGEISHAQALWARAASGFPPERLALHVCRGNWTPDESAALSGDYRPLVDVLARAPVGTLFLELCTPRAGEMEVLRAIPGSMRIGVGAVNPKDPRVEPAAEVLARARRAVDLFGADRVLLTPDCGFATFADNPVASAEAAEGKLRSLAEASQRLRGA